MERELFAKIHADPESDGPRLVYADWLQERGDPRGEFIAVQCAIARAALGDGARGELAARADALLATHAAEWLGPLRGARRWSFRRGLLDEVEIEWTALEAALRESSTGALDVRALTIVRTTPDLAAPQMDLLVARLGRVAHLDLSGMWLVPAAIDVLARAPSLNGVTTLNLGNNGIGDDGVAALLASPHLSNLDRLILDTNRITDAGLRRLIDWPRLGRLRELDLGSVDSYDPWANRISDEGLLAWAGSPSPTPSALRRLDLGESERVGDAGVVALVRSLHVANVVELDLSFCRLGEVAVEAICSPGILTELTDLDLSWTRVDDHALGRLIASPHFDRLTRLRLGGFAGLTARGLEALVGASGGSRLADVTFHHSDEATSALFESLFDAAVERFGCFNNVMSERAAARDDADPPPRDP